MKETIKTTLLGATIGGVSSVTLVAIVFLLFTSEEPFQQDHATNTITAGKTSNTSDLNLRLLEDLLGSEYEKFVETINVLETQSTTQLSNLINETLQLDPSNNLRLLQEFLVVKLVHADPESALDIVWDFPWYRWQDLIGIVISEWSTLDLEQTLIAVEQLPFFYREEAVRTILASRPDVSIEHWHDLTGELPLADIFERLLQEVEVITLLEEPYIAWDQVVQDNISNSEQEELLVRIAIARIETEGYGVLEHLYDTLYPKYQFVFESILRKILDDAPELAYETVKNMSVESRKVVAPILFKSWASQQPRKAYNALLKIDDYKQHWSLSTVLQEWVKVDAMDLLDNIHEIQRGDRNSAVSAIVMELAKVDPEAVAVRLDELKQTLGVYYELDTTFVDHWARHDPIGATNWVQENIPAGSSRQGNLLFWALRGYVELDVDRAIEIALNQPPDSHFVQAGQVGNLLSWVTSNGHLDKAIDLLDELPAGARYSGYATVGRKLVEIERWDEALNLALDLEGDTRDFYLNTIISTAIYSNVPGLINQLQAMPDDNTRQYISSEIIRQHEWRGNVLTEQQLEYVQSLLPGDYENEDTN